MLHRLRNTYNTNIFKVVSYAYLTILKHKAGECSSQQGRRNRWRLVQGVPLAIQHVHLQKSGVRSVPIKRTVIKRTSEPLGSWWSAEKRRAA